MKKFILISFGFMAWTFYEMSGGSDFDPQAIKTARIEAYEAERLAKGLPAQEPVAAPTPVVVAEAPAVVVDTDPPLRDTDVTRVALNLTTLDSVIDDAENAAGTDAAQSGFATASQDNVPQNVSLVTSSADTPAIIPSLINPNETAVTYVPVGNAADAAADDIRSVSANRVNVRGGPGTDFSVVAKLVAGDEIRVLEDNGAGWVRFESVEGGTSGWLADFLLTGG